VIKWGIFPTLKVHIMVNIRYYIAGNADKPLDYIIAFLHNEGYTYARISQCLKDYINRSPISLETLKLESLDGN